MGGGGGGWGVLSLKNILRTFARKFSNIDFFPQILPLNDYELVTSECKRNRGSPTSFWRELARKNTLNLKKSGFFIANKATVSVSPKILQLHL